jgi:hypothetical protein
MSHTVRSYVQDPELARQSNLDWSLGSMDADCEATGYPSEYILWYNNW